MPYTTKTWRTVKPQYSEPYYKYIPIITDHFFQWPECILNGWEPISTIKPAWDLAAFGLHHVNFALDATNFSRPAMKKAVIPKSPSIISTDCCRKSALAVSNSGRGKVCYTERSVVPKVRYIESALLRHRFFINIHLFMRSFIYEIEKRNQLCWDTSNLTTNEKWAYALKWAYAFKMSICF